MLTGVGGQAAALMPRLVITPDGFPIPDKNTPLEDFDPLVWEITQTSTGLVRIRHRSVEMKEEG